MVNDKFHRDLTYRHILVTSSVSARLTYQRMPLEKLSQHDAQDAKKTFWNVSVLILQIVKPMNIHICTTQVHNAQAYSKQYT